MGQIWIPLTGKMQHKSVYVGCHWLPSLPFPYINWLRKQKLTVKDRQRMCAYITCIVWELVAGGGEGEGVGVHVSYYKVEYNTTAM